MKRIFPIALIAAGVLLISGAIAWLYINRSISQPTAGALPDSISGISLANATTGEQAITELSDMHGREFPIEFGAIGVYGNREITLWVSGAASEAIAAQMTDAMRSKIAQGNSPFTPIDEIQNDNRVVYVLDGMGQKHYYFQSKKLVIWLAADPAIADAAIQQILEVYP